MCYRKKKKKTSMDPKLKLSLREEDLDKITECSLFSLNSNSFTSGQTSVCLRCLYIGVKFMERPVQNAA